MHIESTITYHCIYQTIHKTNTPTHKKVWRHQALARTLSIGDLHTPLVGRWTVQPLWKTARWFLRKLHTHLPCDPQSHSGAVTPVNWNLTSTQTPACERQMLYVHLTKGPHVGKGWTHCLIHTTEQCSAGEEHVPDTWHERVPKASHKWKKWGSKSYDFIWFHGYDFPAKAKVRS